ncbi:MAG TPA: alpha/beta fold hydrolase [Terracidiphilus sp.]|jgi:pimeloyl-ACP methyl ester carboxylesterase|nr:alpha/beta fold hydrolase [Terracidiphilus sp.]
MSKPIPSKKPSRPAATRPPTANGSHNVPPTISARWILGGVVVALLAAALCVWGALCLTFWQGSWQLLYHPTAAVTRTPANVGLAFDSIDFAATESGQPELHGWWIASASNSRFTAIYLHGANGNISGTVDALIPLHSAGLNVLDFDYRGYGESQFIHPSEQSWREDAESAIDYLRNTRHIPAGSLILVGTGLGANLALEVASAHPEIAGVVLDEPLDTPMDGIFNDSRARLVPAHLLVHDRWDTAGSAANLGIPSLWFYRISAQGHASQIKTEAYEKVPSRKMRVWLDHSPDAVTDYFSALSRWFDELADSRKTQ